MGFVLSLLMKLKVEWNYVELLLKIIHLTVQ